jgi:hypothetical protein
VLLGDVATVIPGMREKQLLGVAGCCWVLLGVAGCCWVQGDAGCCWVSLGDEATVATGLQEKNKAYRSENELVENPQP